MDRGEDQDEVSSQNGVPNKKMQLQPGDELLLDFFTDEEDKGIQAVEDL